jgi:hypothetical protein
MKTEFQWAHTHCFSGVRPHRKQETVGRNAHKLQWGQTTLLSISPGYPPMTHASLPATRHPPGANADVRIFPRGPQSSTLILAACRLSKAENISMHSHERLCLLAFCAASFIMSNACPITGVECSPPAPPPSRPRR